MTTTKQWAVGDVLTAVDMNVWAVPIAVIKPADTARSGTNVLADDPDLVLAVAANSTYDVRGVTFYDGPSSGGNIQWAYAIPGGASGQYAALHQNISGSFAGSFTSNWTDSGGLPQQANTVGVGAPNILTITWSGILVVAGTSGNLTFRWAQNASSGTNTHVKAQSYLIAQRIA